MRILKFNDLESRPDKDTERVQWNESWERDLKANYTDIRRKRGILSPTGLLDQVGSVDSSKVCQLQQDLCEYAVRHLTNDQFAEKWKGHPRAQRDEVLLEALFQACAIGNLESHRVWCPEMTISYLGGNGGRGLLGLLLESLPEDLEQAFLEPKFISHAEVDLLLQYKQFSTNAARIKLQRAYFMTMVLLYTLLLFYSEAEEYKSSRMPALPSPVEEPSPAPPEPVTVDSVPDEGSRLPSIPDDYKELEFRAYCEDRSDSCMNCLKKVSELPDGQELMVCRPCKLIKRSVRYCSRECQKTDWKHGTSYHCAHKLLCGKPISNSSPIRVIANVPLADPGFERNPALLRQISFLEQPGLVDYMLFNPPHNEKVFVFPDYVKRGTDKAMFLVMRQRALRNGSPAAVKMMCNLMKPYGSIIGYSLDDIKRQFQDEYGVDVDSVVEIPAQPTTKEIGEVRRLSSFTMR